MNNVKITYIKRNRTELKKLSYRFKSRLTILQDKYLNAKELIRLFFPIILSLFIIILSINIIVYTSYERKIITRSEDIPTELRDGVVFIKYEDFLNNNNQVQQIAMHIKELYISQKITSIYIFSYSENKNIFPVKDTITSFFKDIPSEKLNIDIIVKNDLDFCKKIKSDYALNKFILIANKDSAIRLGYICNSIGLFVKEYVPKDLNDNTSFIDSFIKNFSTIYLIETYKTNY